MFSVVITSAGSGSRLGLGYNKLIHKINGKTIIELTLLKFINNDNINQIIVVVSKDDYKIIKSELSSYDVELVIGGSTRGESVYKGLQLVKNEFVMVHDGARCNLSKNVIENVIKNQKKDNCVFPAINSVDTVRFDENKLETLNRDKVFLVQTPQSAPVASLKLSYEKSFKNNYSFTDDISVLQKFSNLNVVVVEGCSSNFKVTYQNDLDYLMFLESERK